jgi:hypothetical protein
MLSAATSTTEGVVSTSNDKPGIVETLLVEEIAYLAEIAIEEEDGRPTINKKQAQAVADAIKTLRDHAYFLLNVEDLEDAEDWEEVFRRVGDMRTKGGAPPSRIGHALLRLVDENTRILGNLVLKGTQAEGCRNASGLEGRGCYMSQKCPKCGLKRKKGNGGNP